MDSNFQNILNKLYSHANYTSKPHLSEETYILAIESVYGLVYITDKEGIVQYVNSSVERITGYERKEILGKKVGLWGGIMEKSFYKSMWATILKGKVFKSELQNHRKNGDIYTARITVSPIFKKNRVIGFVGTEEDVTIEKKVQKEKEEFISLASHQLRTPLGAMKWGLELLASSNPKLEGTIASLASQNQLMIDLVNRLLIVMRIADNRLQVKKKECVVSEIIDSILLQNKPRLQKNKIHLTVQNNNPGQIILTDPVLLKEIILNLIDNSVKYSINKGRITIEINNTKSHWSIRVSDTGIGISKKDLSHVCEKFYRGENVIGITGTGLGLYIINTYSHILKGTLKIKSKVNKGTEILCTFPLK